MHLQFDRELIPIVSKRGNFLYEENRNLVYVDWLGQYILQTTKIGTNRLLNCKLPSEVKEFIFPLTVRVRGRIVDSEATLTILNADNYSNRKDQEVVVQRVFESFGHTVEFLGVYVNG
jgi:hypothetical protein